MYFFVAADAQFRGRQGGLDEQIGTEARLFAEDVAIVEGLEPTEAPLELQGQARVRSGRSSVAYRRLYRELLDRFTDARERGAPFEASGSWGGQLLG